MSFDTRMNLSRSQNTTYLSPSYPYLYIQINGKKIEKDPLTQKSNLTFIGKISKIWILHQFGKSQIKDTSLSFTLKL